MPSSDPVRRGLERLVLAIVEPLVRWTRVYPATVVSQRSDGTLDVRVDPPSGLSASKPVTATEVPIRGLPGVAVKVRPGAAVLLAYQDGDRARPVAALFDASSLLELTITASAKVVVDAPLVELADAAGAVLREGDAVSIPGPSGGAAGTITITGPLRSKVKA